MKVFTMPQRSEIWFQIRLGKPTASNFSRIIKSTGKPSASRDKYAAELAAEIYSGGKLNSWGGNLSIDRGNFLEEKAIAAYEWERDVKAELVGFVTNDEETVGCSPDALIGTDGLLEIKCLDPMNHLAALDRWKMHGTIDPGYIQQTQGQMMLCERQWCDLVFFSVSLPVLIVRQTPIKTVVDGLLEGLPKVLAERDRVLKMLKEFDQTKPAPCVPSEDFMYIGEQGDAWEPEIEPPLKDGKWVTG